MGYYDLQIKVAEITYRMRPNLINKGMKFNSTMQNINIDEPEKSDLLARSNSIAPGEGISGLLMYIGEPEIRSIRGNFNYETQLIINIIDIEGNIHQTKIVSQKNQFLTIHDKLGFEIKDIILPK